MAILRRVFFIEKLCNFELHNGCCWMKCFAIRKHWWRERERGRWVFPWKNYLALTDISNAAAAVLIYLYNQNILICCFCILFICNPINNGIKRQKMKSVCFFMSLSIYFRALAHFSACKTNEMLKQPKNIWNWITFWKAAEFRWWIGKCHTHKTRSRHAVVWTKHDINIANWYKTNKWCTQMKPLIVYSTHSANNYIVRTTIWKYLFIYSNICKDVQNKSKLALCFFCTFFLF